MPAPTMNSDPADAAPSLAAPILDSDPTNGDTLITASPASASTLPSSTDGADSASYSNYSTPDSRLLNYYFLLLAIVIIVIALVWWSIARRRKKRGIHMRSNQHSVLARDVEMWPGTRRGIGRWRFGGAEPRAAEGLNERGEAPPPYLKEPNPVHHIDGPGMELHDLSRGEAKPPGYDEASARR